MGTQAVSPPRYYLCYSFGQNIQFMELSEINKTTEKKASLYLTSTQTVLGDSDQTTNLGWMGL